MYLEVKVSEDSSPKADERGDINMDLRGREKAEGFCKAEQNTVAIGSEKG